MCISYFLFAFVCTYALEKEYVFERGGKRQRKRERKKWRTPSWVGREVGSSWRNWERGKHDQNTLYENLKEKKR